MGILYTEQQEISNDIYSGLKKQELYNIPTGRGKTFILLDVAMKCFREDNKNVIISVSNNYLVREMYQVAKKYFDKKKRSHTVSIQIGRDNYIDTGKLILQYKNGILDNYCKTESLQSFIRKYNTSIAKKEKMFFDTFNEEVEYIDTANQFIVRELIKDTGNDKPIIDGITITNHYYLLSKSMYSKDFNLSEYAVLVDEVHEIADVFMQINTNSFSFFDYKNMMQRIKKEVENKKDFVGKISLVDALKKQSVRANNALKKHIEPSLVGQYFSIHDKSKQIREEVVSLLGKKEHSLIDRQTKKQNIDVSPYFSKVTEIYSGIKITDQKTNRISMGVYYSPSLGYPTLSISSSNPLGKLYGLFWDKISYFAGVSGSVTSSFSPNEKEIRYGYARLGFLKRDDHRKISFYSRTFPRENISIEIVDAFFYEGIHKESVYDKDFKEADSPYYEKIIDFIYKKENGKNSMILCSGYKEALYLSTLYRLKYGDSKTVHFSKPTEKPLATLAKFRKEGGVFFATKNYGTGTSLEGEHLVNLFILKMPYPDYTAKFWQELKKKSEGIFRQTFEREMMITLMQILGRVARTENDKGNIFLLDYYFSKKPKNKRDILKIVEEYGVIKVTEEKQPVVVSSQKMKALFS